MRSVLVAAIALLTGVSFNAAPRQDDALAQFREALGGDAALNAVRTIRARGKIKFKPNDDHFDIAVALPDRFISTVRMFRRHNAFMSTTQAYLRNFPEPTGAADREPSEITSGFNGDLLLPIGTERGLQNSKEATPRVLDSTRAKMAEFLLPLIAATPASYPVVTRSEAHAINFSAVGGREWRLELDPMTHLPTRMIWTYPALPGSPATVKRTVRAEFSDFRVVSGLRWPHRIVTQKEGGFEGTLIEDATVERYEVNAELSEKMFRK